MPKEIQLTRGFVAVVDDADYSHLSAYKWCASGSTTAPYAARYTGRGTGRSCILMHREILQPTGPFVDHIDGDRLNNQRANLREATRTENNCNSKMRKHNTSGHKGVYWHAQRGKWHAQVTLHGKTSSKLFADLEAAAEWASNERKRLHGAFASNG